MNVKELIAHIYKSSSLPNFLKLEYVDNPHVNVIRHNLLDVNNNPITDYITLDNYTVNASISEFILKNIEKKYEFDLDSTNLAFLDTLKSEAYKSLDNILLKYLDSNCDIEYLPLKNIQAKEVKKYLRKNQKISFFKKPKVDPYEFFHNVLYHNHFDTFHHYIIVSPELANFISSSQFFRPKNNRLPYIHEFGELLLRNYDDINNYGFRGVALLIKVFVNPNTTGKELYISTYDEDFKCFYYANDTCFQEFLNLDKMRTYRLLMYNKIYDMTRKKLKIKKIIFKG